MKLSITKSKNAQSLYVTKSIYVNGKHTSKVVEKLGTYDELLRKLDGQDPIEWAKEYIAKLNEQEKAEKRDVLVKYSQSKSIPKGEQRSFNGGYLFLDKLYHELKLDRIVDSISKQYKFEFNLDSILSRLIYGRILFPTSKLGTMQQSGNLLEGPDFEIQHIYRGLEVIAKETDFIQAELYRNSVALSKRNDRVLYYDCTNYFFEAEQESGLRQYGPSKEHRPNPIVQMGLFMDGDGIPLAFTIDSGNTNEQRTMKPLEQKILRDFGLSRFVVCTDAGLSSTANRRFNDAQARGFITTQSVKKLKGHLREWALDPQGWKLSEDTGTSMKARRAPQRVYDLTALEETPQTKQAYQDATFYKERWINEDGLEQRLIVTYSMKYRDYQRQIRSEQIARAVKLVATNPSRIDKRGQNDYKRLIQRTAVTSEGELANKELYHIDQAQIDQEEQFDGFYAVCTNLDDKAYDVLKIAHSRWEIEESFRIMKSEFKARPVFLSRDDRITAHFTTCFLALTLFRYLEKRLGERFTSCAMIRELRDMNFTPIPGEGYIPTYTRTDFTDALHDAFGFRTDLQIVSNARMKKIIKDCKQG